MNKMFNWKYLFFSLILGFIFTTISPAFLTYSREYCRPVDRDVCDGYERPMVGWPWAFIEDSPGTSVIGSLGAEDIDLSFEHISAFLGDVIICSMIIYLMIWLFVLGKMSLTKTVN
jgi:hypothetical protein